MNTSAEAAKRKLFGELAAFEADARAVEGDSEHLSAGDSGHRCTICNRLPEVFADQIRAVVLGREVHPDYRLQD